MCLFPPRDQLWRQVFRDGIAPQLTDADLDLLAQLLADDDPRLLQGETVRVWEDRLTGACALAAVGWLGRGLERRVNVEIFFTDVCEEADRLMGAADVVSWFTAEFWDSRPRQEVFAELYDEVSRERERRRATRCAVSEASN